MSDQSLVNFDFDNYKTMIIINGLFYVWFVGNSISLNFLYLDLVKYMQIFLGFL